MEKGVEFSGEACNIQSTNGGGKPPTQVANELVGHTVQKRNWKGIVIALVVIFVVCALIVATIILISPSADNSVKKEKFTFEDFITKKFAPKSFSLTWASADNAFYYRDEDGAVIKYNCTANSSNMVMDNSTFKELDTGSFTISPDETYALLPYEIEHIYRHSRRAKYKVVNLVDGAPPTNLHGPEGLVFQYVKWSPTYDALVFVQKNDIYYRRSVLGTTEADAVRVTNTGIPDEIFNGVPDWVFEEEILGEDNAIWWSPDGRYFLFASFNDTEVGRYDLTYYGEMTKLYVTNKKLLYPKTGTTNPTFTLNIYDTQLNISLELSPPDEFQDTDHYFTTVSWKDKDNVLVTWMNRAQNLSIFSICNANNGSCYENYRYQAKSGWVSVYTAPIFTTDGSHYFVILPQAEGEAGSFRHIAMVDANARVNTRTEDNGNKEFITTGHFDVISIQSYIAGNNTLYYLAYKTGDPTSRHVFRATTLKSDPEYHKPVCVTCSYSDDCDWVSTEFSTNGQFYMLKCLGPGVPTYTLHSTAGETEAVIFEDNKAMAEKISMLALPRVKYVKIPLPNKQVMNAKVLLPAVLKESDNIQYNILTKVYGGPDSQMVTKAFSLGWEDYLSSTHNVVIGLLDARGTSGRGDRWRHANYRHLGSTEVEDTITAGRYFNKLKYVGQRRAIWGWSYGGYLSSLVLGQDSGAFDCGMSVAPVTDWRYYDTVYTERYMGLPDDNKEAYDFGNVSRYADNFKHSKFMLVHGTGDDNVHFQNTAQLVRALTEANVYFRSQFYTDQQHSINGGNSRKHLYNTLEDFLLQCFGGRTTYFDDLNSQDDTEKDND